MILYGLGLLKLQSPAILACKSTSDASTLLEGLGETLDNAEALESLTKAAFVMQVHSASFRRVSMKPVRIETLPKAHTQNHLFCRPRLFEPRGSCPDDLWPPLWAELAASFRIYDPQLVYCPGMHGTSVRTCLEICKNHQGSPMIFFLYTLEGVILGGFSPAIWEKNRWLS